jgi:hypothetical protein
VFDLVADDDVVRGRALARHRALVAASTEALHWSNRVWMQAGTPAPEEPHLAAEMDQARAAERWHRDQTIFGYLHVFLAADPGDCAVRTVFWPFAALYLRWETRYPLEWRAPESNLWSPWARKEGLLRHLGRHGVPEEFRREAADLVVTAIGRPYRCKDWRYAMLVRHVADRRFGAAVTALAGADDPLVRLRARFVLDLAGDPERPLTRKTWRRWLDHQ